MLERYMFSVIVLFVRFACCLDRLMLVETQVEMMVKRRRRRMKQLTVDTPELMSDDTYAFISIVMLSDNRQLYFTSVALVFRWMNYIYSGINICHCIAESCDLHEQTRSVPSLCPSSLKDYDAWLCLLDINRLCAASHQRFSVGLSINETTGLRLHQPGSCVAFHSVFLVFRF